MSSQLSVVQGSSGKPATKSPRAHGEVAEERHPVMGGEVLKPHLRWEIEEMDTVRPLGLAQGDPRAVFRHLKGCHGEKGLSLLCGLKGSSRHQPGEVATVRARAGTDGTLAEEARGEGGGGGGGGGGRGAGGGGGSSRERDPQGIQGSDRRGVDLGRLL